MIRCVVFDFGQVLASPPGLFEVLAGRIGAKPAEFEQAYWIGRRAYDAGGPAADYWGCLLRTLQRPVEPATVDLLTELDAELWTPIRPEAHRLLQDVRAAGVGVAVLSNAPAALEERFASQGYAGSADHWFVSASLGMCKPDPRVYAHVQRTLGVPPDTIAFVDDRPANVDAARQAGWQAHLWRDDADTRSWLVGLGVLSA